MVVMPYTPTNDKNMEDLFTKAPVTHIIGAEPFKTKEETNKPKHSRRRPPVKFNDADNDLTKKSPTNEEKKKYSATVEEKNKPVTSRTQVRGRRPEVTTPRSETITTTYRSRPTQTTTYHPKTRRPLRRRTTTSPPTQYPNHRYSDEFVPNEGIRIIESPKLVPTQSNEDLDLDENTKQEVVLKQKIPISASFISTKPNYFGSTTTTTTTTTVKSKPLVEEINVPDNLKSVMKDLNLEAALNPQNDNIKISLEEQNRIKNMLASIGALPDTTTTTTTSLPNAANVAESLSPEMRDLLMSFGLLPNPNEKPVSADLPKYYPEAAEVKPESYIGFKPLPDDGPSRDDMDALLASFGLGRSARKEKAIKTNNNEQPYNVEMVPDYLKGVLTDMGISQMNRQEKKISTPTIPKTAEKQHVFNPDTQYATEDELKKLEKLIGMIKQLEKMNGTASEEDLKKIDMESLKELVSSLNGHNNETFVTLEQKYNSPNPNDFDIGVSKNEIKRQESTTTSTTTEESETPSLKDLEASFGGETETSTEAHLPETTPSVRTGFYYLVDWNSFLDIDDTKGKRVNLRFQPTIGDPKRFLSVSVP
ncbi:hypothetical protein BDFB_000450 [Asbolus verrucosus]|uniref:Uncharacterized protein n=1 Tax=Asbolus verrucosus TaxID=1661398 RepID=A0A482WDF8_ASBVE|nr:hypothetical protein BDFB_000450 [Asbolus verrucosus]